MTTSSPSFTVTPPMFLQPSLTLFLRVVSANAVYPIHFDYTIDWWFRLIYSRQLVRMYNPKEKLICNLSFYLAHQ